LREGHAAGQGKKKKRVEIGVSSGERVFDRGLSRKWWPPRGGGKKVSPPVRGLMIVSALSCPSLKREEGEIFHDQLQGKVSQLVRQRQERRTSLLGRKKESGHERSRVWRAFQRPQLSVRGREFRARGEGPSYLRAKDLIGKGRREGSIKLSSALKCIGPEEGSWRKDFFPTGSSTWRGTPWRKAAVR